MRIGGVPVVNTGFGPGGPGATLFLHERTTPSGVRRLVAVHLPAGGPAVVGLPVPAPVVVQPATLTAGPSVRGAVAKIHFNVTMPTPSTSFGLMSRPVGTTARYFAGRPDPSNPSRFTIAFETNGGRGEIEGFLDEGDTLRLAVTSGPAGTQPASAGPGPGTLRMVGTATVDGSNVPAKGPNAGRTGNVNTALQFNRLEVQSAAAQLRVESADVAPPAARPGAGTRRAD
jgi:hypothetical protein